jgi:hypothetical protein
MGETSGPIIPHQHIQRPQGLMDSTNWSDAATATGFGVPDDTRAESESNGADASIQQRIDASADLLIGRGPIGEQDGDAGMEGGVFEEEKVIDETAVDGDAPISDRSPSPVVEAGALEQEEEHEEEYPTVLKVRCSQLSLTGSLGCEGSLVWLPASSRLLYCVQGMVRPLNPSLTALGFASLLLIFILI